MNVRIAMIANIYLVLFLLRKGLEIIQKKNFKPSICSHK